MRRNMEMQFTFCDGKTLQHLFIRIDYVFDGAAVSGSDNSSSSSWRTVCAQIRNNISSENVTSHCHMRHNKNERVYQMAPVLAARVPERISKNTFELFCRLRVSSAFITSIFLHILLSNLHKSIHLPNGWVRNTWRQNTRTFRHFTSTHGHMLTENMVAFILLSVDSRLYCCVCMCDEKTNAMFT